jgi:hypothetical protein
MSREDHESQRMEPAGSGATWTGSPNGVFAGRKHHKPRLALNNGVNGMNDMAGKAVRATVECIGKVPRCNITAGVRPRRHAREEVAVCE